ncbi:MAG TPA: PAS domain S-box protein [Terriglobia bacterium]|nr:PAS domain S-box protein [Terriglobia bacterium]
MPLYKKGMQLSTNFKLYTASAGVLALLLTIALSFHRAGLEFDQTLSFVGSAHEVLARLDAVVLHLNRAESAARNYVVSGVDSSRGDYAQELIELRRSMSDLRRLTWEDEAQRQSIVHMALLVDRRIAGLNAALYSWSRGGEESGIGAADIDAAAHLTKDVRIIADQIARDQRRLFAERSDPQSPFSASGRRIVLLATIFATLFVIASTSVIRRDILRRERSESALRAAEQRIRSIFENAPIGIFEASENGRWLTANASMASILGYDSPEDLLHHRNELQSPLYVDPNVRAILVNKLNEKGVIQDCETNWYRKDGTTVWVTGNSRIVDDGAGQRHFEAMLIDITERKLAESQLANVKSQLENVLNSATGVSIVSTDVHGRITLFNPGAERILGYSADEVIGRTWDCLQDESEIAERLRELNNRLDRPAEPFDALVETVRREGHETREWTYVRKDGGRLTVSLTVTGIRDSLGELTGFLVIGRDITERKRAEQDRANLERQLRRKNIALERETRRALEASRMKSEFLANMSHELRTPLNGIIGFAEMMHDEVIGPVDAEHKEFLDDILTSARHLLQLINDILDLSKVEAGKMEFQPEDIDLRVTIGEIHGILKSLSNKRQLSVETTVDPRIKSVHLDPRKLKQVLYNYLSNAIKFTPEGGHIWIRATLESANAFRIEVQDTGIGIKREDLDQLFTEFHQLDSSASKRYQGTGLGLALTKRIAEAQGGRVGVESVLGEGSTFYVVLPFSSQPLVVADSGADALDRQSMEGVVDQREVGVVS